MTQPQVVYVPFKAGLPPMRAYLRSLWHRRAFVSEFARSELREQNFGSVFGQLWLVLGIGGGTKHALGPLEPQAQRPW